MNKAVQRLIDLDYKLNHMNWYRYLTNCDICGQRFEDKMMGEQCNDMVYLGNYKYAHKPCVNTDIVKKV